MSLSVPVGAQKRRPVRRSQRSITLRSSFTVLCGLAVSALVTGVMVLASPAPANTAVTFFLPYETDTFQVLSQRPGGGHSHSCPGQRCYAYDFGNRDTEGFDVWASAPGVVEAVEDQGDGLFGLEEDINDGNFVRLRHDDGTCTVYGQLAFDSVPASVVIGERIDVGTVIGRSGATGHPRIDDLDRPIPALKFFRTNCNGFSQPIAFVEGRDLITRTTSQNPGLGGAGIVDGELVRAGGDPVLLAAGGLLVPIGSGQVSTFQSIYGTTVRDVPAQHADIYGNAARDGEVFVEQGSTTAWLTEYGHRRQIGTAAQHPEVWTVPAGGLDAVPEVAPPGPLRDLASVWDGNDLWIGWLSPSSSGGSPLTDFVVRVEPGGVRVLTTETHTVVAGLDPTITYTVTVRARNVAGGGPGSTIEVGTPPPVRTGGYWMLETDGTVYGFGDADDHSASGVTASAVATVPSGLGVWVLLSNGQVRTLEGAQFHGHFDMSVLQPGEHPSALSVLADGSGYWVFTDRGRVTGFGAAAERIFGDLTDVPLNGPIVGSAATATGLGYYLIGSDGGVFGFGDAQFHGSMGGIPLNQPVRGIAPDPDGVGYWLVASDGGIFAFEAEFRGSMGSVPLNGPVVGAVAYADGYLMVGADGGVFNFSSEPFFGSLGANPPDTPVVSIAAYAGG